MDVLVYPSLYYTKVKNADVMLILNSRIIVKEGEETMVSEDDDR